MSYWQDKVAIVTGGSAGLGRAIATELVRQRARVVIAARDPAKLDEAVRELSQWGTISAIAADATNTAQVENLVLTTVKRHERLDLLVNNVGRSTRGKILDTTPEQFQEFLDINFLSVVRCVRAAAPYLVSTSGHIVNIGSLATKSAARYLGAYPASKFPLAAYSQQLRYELGPMGVHVLLACPGPIRRENGAGRYDEISNGLPESAKRPGGGVKLRGLVPEHVARRILAACVHRRPEIVLPGRARLLFTLAQLWPELADWIQDRFTSK